MRAAAIIMVAALFGVALAHPHPRRIERSAAGAAQIPDPLSVGVLDAGVIYASEAHIGNLSSGSTRTSFLDGGIVQFAYMNSSTGDLAYDNGLTYVHTMCLDDVWNCESYFNQTGTESQIYMRDGRPFSIEGHAQTPEREYWFHYGLDGGNGGAWEWSGAHVKKGGVEWLSGTGALFKPGSALEIRGRMEAADAGFGGSVTVAGTSTLNVVDAGIVYFQNLSSPGRNFVTGMWTLGDGSGPAAEGQALAPVFATGPHPPKFGSVNVMWSGSGSGGTSGVQVEIYDYPAGPVLCSCFVGPCSGAGHANLSCACNTEALPNKIYAGRIGTATDCAANPSDVKLGVVVMR